MANFSASASALGYLYQCKFALWGALQRVKRSPDLTIAIECLDDVSFEASGQPAELLQTKHSTTPGSLTDSSADLWKTIRVWCETPAARDGDGPLFLITTSTAQSGSVAERLGPTSARDVLSAELALSTIAKSDGKTLAAAFEAFNDLNLEQRLDVLSRVTVLDNQVTASGLQDRIQEEVRFTTDKRNVPALVERLEGWWWQQCIDHLTDPIAHPLSGEALEAKIGELRDQLHYDNLPIDDLAELDEATSGLDATGRPFVQQLELIDLIPRRISFAVRDYLRAFAQKSRWHREGLLQVNELERYERRLTEAWELRFAAMADQLGDDAAEKAKIHAAKILYEWVELHCNEKIRPACDEGFVIRGSFHQLADRQALGWHLDFEARLAALLDPAAAGAS